jgi:hypothetical protein
MRFEKGDMVKLLKPAPFSLITLDVTGNDKNELAVNLRIDNTGHSMYNTGTTYHQTYSWPSSQIPVGLSSIACTLLIPEGNKPDSAGNASLGDFNNRNSNNTKHNMHLQRAQRLGNKLSTSDYGLL